MKWMGGWSVDDLNQCPIDVYDQIVEMILEEIDDNDNQ